VTVALTLDEGPLHRLLDLAGPDSGLDLLDRLRSDLGAVQRGLVTARGLPDWKAMCDHCHVLISLAGAVGEGQVLALAQAFYLLSHRKDRSALGEPLTTLLARIEAMIRFVVQVRDSYVAQPE